MNRFVLLAICIGWSIGKTQALSIAPNAANQLRRELEATSAKLENAISNGVDAAKEAVREMSQGLVALADSVDVRMSSGDLAHIGKDAAIQLKEALVGLSQTWKFAVDAADLKEVGVKAAVHLAKAQEKISDVISVEYCKYYTSGYTSGVFLILVGVAVIILFMAVFVCLGRRLPCWKSRSRGGGQGGKDHALFINKTCEPMIQNGESIINKSSAERQGGYGEVRTG